MNVPANAGLRYGIVDDRLQVAVRRWRLANLINGLRGFRSAARYSEQPRK
jgi:hypothetical protein